MNRQNENILASINLVAKKAETIIEQAAMEGMLTEKSKKLYELAKNQEVTDKLFAADTIEEAQSVFREYGLELTVEEVKELAAQIVDVCNNIQESDGELSEEDLENVAGGGLLAFFGSIGSAIAGMFAKTYVEKGIEYAKDYTGQARAVVGSSVRVANMPGWMGWLANKVADFIDSY